jgi:NDP-sugar pyrophosphorylase family protein
VAPLEPGVAADFGHDLFPAALARGLPLYGYELGSAAIDVGTHEGLQLARSLSSRGATAA